MSNPFGPQDDAGSYANLRKKLLQRVAAANIDKQIMAAIEKSYEAENVVLSRPERKRLFSDVVNAVLQDLTKKIDDDSISI